VDLRLFETGKTTAAERSLWQGVQTRLGLMWRWWRLFAVQPRPIAHIHTCSGFTFFLDGLLLLLCRWRRAPVLLHIHGARFDAFLDSLNPLMRACARWLGGLAHTVIVLSPEWLERMRERWPSARLVVVANGVAAESAARGVEEGGDRPGFVFLGNLGHRKGVPQILDAAALARHAWHLKLAGGEEDPGFLAWTREEIRRRGLTDRLQVLGPVVGAAKADLLAQAQGFVLPSLAEGLPMALLEAMAAGLPAVVSAAGAMPEVVRDGRDGLVVPVADAAALAAALDRLAGDASLRGHLGHSAARRCNELYGIDRMAAALCEVYTRVQAER
jgi:glycosyltransferase involved in cell wall biosynthesis